MEEPEKGGGEDERKNCCNDIVRFWFGLHCEVAGVSSQPNRLGENIYYDRSVGR